MSYEIDVEISDRWINTNTASQYANVCVDYIYTAAAAGRLQHVRVAGKRKLLFKQEWIDAWLMHGGQGS